MNLIKAVRFVLQYQSCIDELMSLVTTLHNSVKDGKISQKDSSRCMKKYWALVKAIEKVS